MHVFQDLDINDTEFNPFKMIGQDWAALVSEAGDKTNATAVRWGGFGVLWDKNVATVYVRNTRYTKELLDAGEYFSLTFFNPDQPKYKSALKYMKMASGRVEDKIKAAGLTLAHRDGIPYIDDGSTIVICRTLASFDMPADHVRTPLIREQFFADGTERTMYVGEIKGLFAR